MIIIGIIAVGAVLTGRSVLARARVASLLANVKDLATASREFKTRYGYYPGDLPSAGTYITLDVGTGCTDGTAVANMGNGIVDTSKESNCALEHLVKAGMLSKLDYDSANNKYTINSPIAPGVQVSLWVNSATNENVVRITNLPCDVALEMDSRFDSGTTTTPPTPFSQGWVIAQDATNTQIQNCIPSGAVSGGVSGPVNDPVPTLLIKY